MELSGRKKKATFPLFFNFNFKLPVRVCACVHAHAYVCMCLCQCMYICMYSYRQSLEGDIRTLLAGVTDVCETSDMAAEI